MTTPVSNQTPPPKASFVKRAACAIGRGVVNIADFTGTVALTATAVIAGGGLGIGIVHYGEKALQNRKNFITYIPSSVIARLPQRLQPSVPEVTQSEPAVKEPTITLQPPVADQEGTRAIEQPTTTTIEPKQTEAQAQIAPAAKGNMAKTLLKVARVTVGIIVIGAAINETYKFYQSTQTPAEYPSPVKETTAETHQERLHEQTQTVTLEASAAPSKKIASQTQVIEVLPNETIVVPSKPELIVPPSGPVVTPTKPELILPQAPQPLELPTNKEGIAVFGMSASQALELVRSGKPLPKGVTLQQFGISEAAVGRRVTKTFLSRGRK